VRRAPSFALLFFAFVACAAGAQELSVTYVDGDVQIREGSSWTALSIGDRLTPQTTIQLGQGAYVEIKRASSKIVLSQKGSYVLANVIASSRAMGSAGVGKALSATLSYLAGGKTLNQSSVGGARAENKGKEDDSEWMSSGAEVFLDAGKTYMKSGQYGAAIDQFLQALDAATEQELPQVRYYLAYAYSLDGDTRAALKYATDLQPSRGDEWASDFIILKAKLLVDSSAFAQDIAWLTQSGNDLSADAQRGAVYQFLLGLGYRGIGDAANAKARLSKVVATSAESDIGRAAEQLLQNP
jgi:tetratricopeptide (TPR) repeat protein